MESVNVLVSTKADTNSLEDECLRQITAVSSRIKMRDVSDFVRAELGGDFSSKEQFDALLAEAEVIYGLLPQNVIARAPKLKWWQMMGVGFHTPLGKEVAQSSVTITGVSGINAIPMGELVLMLMLMFVRQAPLCFQLKQNKQWYRFAPSELHAKTVGIVGLGNIGREVTRLAKVFGMRVLATRRSAKRVTRTRYVDTVLPREQLPQLLSDSDFVVLALPLTPETTRLIGEKELRTMKSTAYLINVARGGIVDEEALIRALDEHWIAGAGLDVFATEPLPAESKLWDLPNVIFSPHIASWVEGYYIRATDVFCENLRRYLSGKKLLNLVDKKKGY